MTTLRISLTLDDFKQLVAGKITTKHFDYNAAIVSIPGLDPSIAVEISLQDIGWGVMLQALEDAWRYQNGLS